MIEKISKMISNLKVLSKMNDIVDGLNTHTTNTNNPHNVTAEQLGLATAYVYKGSVENFSELPTSAQNGWVYSVENEYIDSSGNVHPAGSNFAWNGSRWDDLGGSLSRYTTLDFLEDRLTPITNQVNTNKTNIEDLQKDVDTLNMETIPTAVNKAEAAATNAQNAATSVQKYKALWFDSVASMKAEPSLTTGAYVNTAGYYTPNDGGGASYLIRAKAESDVDDGGSLHELSNGLVAELIIEDSTVFPEQFGAVGDGTSDDTNAIQKSLDASKVVTFRNAYKISHTLIIGDKHTLIGFKHSLIYTDEDILMIQGLNCTWITLQSLVMEKPCGSNYHVVLSGYHHTIDSCYLSGVLSDASNYVSGIHTIPSTTGVIGFELVIKNNQINVGQIVVEGGTDGFIIDNIVWSATETITPPCYAIEVKQNGYDIKGNQVVPGTLGGVLCHGTGGASLFNIIDNYFDGSYDSVLSGSLLYIKSCEENVLISNNKFYNGYKNAITIDNSVYQLIVGNTFINNDRSGTMGADIIFTNHQYGTRSQVTNNQFVNHHDNQTLPVITENKSIIVFCNNSIIGNGYIDNCAYVGVDNFISSNNIINGFVYHCVIDVVQALPDGVYGIVFPYKLANAKVILHEVSINGTSVNYVLEKRWNSLCVIRGDSENVGQVLKAVYIEQI